jgi:indolepyruvate ferredoxin oxidoreductase, alpha subunit
MVTSNVIGVDAICQGLLDGGAESVYNFPGFFSHDIFKALGGEKISLNERVAYSEAFGASLAGKRSVATFKNVGLNVASDAFLHSVIAGVRAGLVLVVTDDVSVWGSQESQDSRSYFDFFGGLWLEPTGLQEAYEFARDAFELSEKFDVPVVIRLTNPYFELEGAFERIEQVKKKPASYPPVDSSKFVVHPVYFKTQQENLGKKNEAIQRAFDKEASIETTKEYSKGVIAVGTVEASRLPIENADVFKVDTYPLPATELREFIDDHDEIEVIEHGNAYVTKQLYEIMGNKKIKSTLPTAMGQKWPFVRWKRYQKFFDALVSVKPDMVISDVTQFTVEENDSVKASLSLGVSVGTSMGYAASAPGKYAYSLSGDCSILHEGIGIIDGAARRQLHMGIIIFDNGGSWCTGGQECTGSIYGLPRTADIKVFNVNFETATTATIAQTLEEMRDFSGVSVLYIKVPMGNFNRD